MKLIYSSEAKEVISSFHPEVKRGLRQLLDELQKNPILGKPLKRELTGFSSLAYKRYRIIYKHFPRDKILRIYLIAHRRKVYDTLQLRNPLGS